MKHFVKVLLIFVAMMLYFGFAQIKVTYVGGEAYVKRGNDNRRITQSMLIKQGDVITTGKRSFVALALADGSVHKISANTVYEVQKNQENDKSRSQLFSLIKGKIFSFVSKTFKSSDIKFLTPTAVVGVRGTAFVIEVNPEDTVVYLIEGRVDLARSLGDVNPPVPLSQGNRATIPPNQAPIIETMSEADFNEAAQGIPLSLGQVIITGGEEVATSGEGNNEEEATVNEIRGYVDESVARVEAQREQVNQNRVWDYQSRKTVGQFRVRQVVSTPADNEIIVATHTLDTQDGRETSLELNMVFDQVIPSYQDVVSGVTRNVDKVDWRINVSQGGVADNLFYSKDYKRNSEEVYFNKVKGTDLNSRQLTMLDSNVRIPTMIKFKINGGEYLFSLDYSYVNNDGTKYSDITINKNSNIYKSILNGDVDTKIHVTAILPSNSIANFLQSGDTFNIIILNDFVFPLFNQASGT